MTFLTNDTYLTKPVSDCYFDNQTFPNVIPLHWTDEQNKDFRRKCRRHNQLVNFGIDPELKFKNETQTNKKRT